MLICLPTFLANWDHLVSRVVTGICHPPFKKDPAAVRFSIFAAVMTSDCMIMTGIRDVVTSLIFLPPKPTGLRK